MTPAKASLGDLKSEELLEATIEAWQPLSPTSLNRDDARQILQNMTGFVDLLLSWEAASAASSGAGEPVEAAA